MGQKIYFSLSLRPFTSFNTLELRKDFVTSEYNFRVYQIQEQVQKSVGGSSAFGPTFLLDLFRINLNASALFSFRSYQFEGRRLIWNDSYEDEVSYLSETLVEFPLLAGVTLFNGKPLKLYLEGGMNYNLIINQSEDEPLLTGGDIYLTHLFVPDQYREYIIGFGARYKRFYMTIRRFERINPPDWIHSDSRFWTMHIQYTFKSGGYSKHKINL